MASVSHWMAKIKRDDRISGITKWIVDASEAEKEWKKNHENNSHQLSAYVPPDKQLHTSLSNCKDIRL